MSLAVYYPQDIANALLAAEQANSAAFEAVIVTDEAAAFQRGYRAALTTLALAFGLIRQEESQTLESLEWDERLSFSRPQLHNRKR